AGGRDVPAEWFFQDYSSPTVFGMSHFEVSDLVDYRVVQARGRREIIDTVACGAAFCFELNKQRVEVDEGLVVLGSTGHVEEARGKRLPLMLVEGFGLEFEDGLAHGVTIFVVAHLGAGGPYN